MEEIFKSKKNYIFFFISLITCFILFNQTITKNLSVWETVNKEGELQKLESIKLESIEKYVENKIFYGYRLKNRDFKEVEEELHYRHFTRWVVASIQSSLFDFFYKNFSPTTTYNLIFVYLSLLTSLAFIFCSKTICKISSYNNLTSYLIIYFSFFFYLFYTTINEIHEYYSIHELLAISACIYYSFKKNFFLYFLFALYGILNRETGLLLTFFYPIINSKDKNNFVALSFLPIIFFIANYDLLFNDRFLQLSTWFAFFIKNNNPITYWNFFSNYEISFSIVKILLLFLPTLLLLYFSKRDKKINKIILLLSLYLLTLILGTHLPITFQYIILIPFLLTINYLTLMRIKKS